MKRIYFAVALFAATFAATSCEKVIDDGRIWDRAYIAFYEDQMTVPAEGGEFYVPINSTGIDSASVGADGGWVQDENGDLLPIDEWIEIVKVVNEYDAEATRALAKWDSAIVIRVKPNDSGYSRSATLSACSFMLTDNIIIRQQGGLVGN